MPDTCAWTDDTDPDFNVWRMAETSADRAEAEADASGRVA